VPCALKISDAAAIAMHAMGLLALDPAGSLSTRSIASCFNISEAHLSKVLQRLVKVGLVRSVRGPKGGFSVAKDPGDVTLLEVFEAIEGPAEPADCVFRVPVCDGRACVLGSVLADANEMLRRHLATTSLRQISRVFLDGRIALPSPLDEKLSTQPSGGRGKL